MHLRWGTVLPLVLWFTLLRFPGVLTSPLSNDASELRDQGSRDLLPLPVFIKRDDSHHHHGGVPLLVLNETEVTMYHAPTPPSFYTLDWDDDDDAHESRHGGLMIVHGIFMSLAFFVSLPLGIALRSVKHAAHGIATLSFYVFCAIGCAASGLYRKMTPNMYEGAVHRQQGYFIILIAFSLSALDILAAARAFLTFLKCSNKSVRGLIAKKEKHFEVGLEYVGLVEEQEEFENSKPVRDSVELQDIRLDTNSTHSHTEQWANSVHRHQRNYSLASEQTAFDAHSSSHSDDTLHDTRRYRKFPSLLHRIGQSAFAVTERALVVAGFTQLLIGIVTYTGGCRENYYNGCLAHLIKGGIFWCYGLLSFARFLGSFADLGWGWNRSPSGDTYTAEFAESFIIFLYGATNTWMERFGAQAGDPFTTKEIQHISIAIMFCFAGLLGMGIESKSLRKWLASLTFSPQIHTGEMREAILEPQSYLGSFNPFPALAIGVTGAAMAAHVQTYLFQVQIHALWGNLLVSFSVMRCLTYFFLWLGPPRSMLPSRPPTEALGSFFLACGGLVFMFSTEEVTIAAMRRGRDDVMMFLNVAVAVTCFSFCWAMLVVGFKGWLKSRSQATFTYRDA